MRSMAMNMVVFLVLYMVAISFVSGQTQDVHDLLKSHYLPRGLLPDNVELYNLSVDGVLSVKLKSKCKVQFKDNESRDVVFHYDTTITGKLSDDVFEHVSGINATVEDVQTIIASAKTLVMFGQDQPIVFSYDTFKDVPSCIIGTSELAQSL